MQLSEQLVITLVFVIGTHGILINTAVLTVYLRLWSKVPSPGLTDQILFSVVLTGLFLQGTMLVNTYYYLSQVHNDLYTKAFIPFLYVLLVEFSMRFWNTAWLSISYCVRLVNISHRIFLQGKKWFSSCIQTLLIGSAVFSVLVNLPLFWTVHTTFSQYNNITNNKDVNITISTGPLHFGIVVDLYYNVFNMLVSFILPCTLTLICIGLSVMSLLHHVWRIRQNLSQSCSSPQLQALVRAVVTMTLHLMLDLTFLVIFNYMAVKSFNLDSKIGLVFKVFFLSHPSVQSYVVIWGNSKLRRGLLGRKSTLETTA